MQILNLKIFCIYFSLINSYKLVCPTEGYVTVLSDVASALLLSLLAVVCVSLLHSVYCFNKLIFFNSKYLVYITCYFIEMSSDYLTLNHRNLTFI